MKIRSVEPTPSPNSMKLNMDERLPEGVKFTFTKDNIDEAPDYIHHIFAIDGIKGVYHVADFLAIDRHPNADWKPILAKVQAIFADKNETTDSQNDRPAEPQNAFGEVKVLVQMLRGIPSQVKLLFDNQEARFGLPERFVKAIMQVQSHTSNYIYERKWDEQGVRYGDVQEIGEEVVRELSAAYDDERINNLVHLAIHEEHGEEQHLSSQDVSAKMDHPDWEKRFAALERLDPTVEDLPILQKALEDDTVSIRRLATVYLGMIEGKDVLPLLYRALQDKSVIVRRTAGDVLSDLGDPDAIPAMVRALHDSNKLVRWRAARYLFEIGDETALDDLYQVQHDDEFEVSLQVRMAIERIESGEEASGTVWQQMTKEMKKSRENADD